jgi:hypothetical protein
MYNFVRRKSRRLVRPFALKIQLTTVSHFRIPVIRPQNRRGKTATFFHPRLTCVRLNPRLSEVRQRLRSTEVLPTTTKLAINSYSASVSSSGQFTQSSGDCATISPNSQLLSDPVKFPFRQSISLMASHTASQRYLSTRGGSYSVNSPPFEANCKC